jgi:CSLREA domain-containing protein
MSRAHRGPRAGALLALLALLAACGGDSSTAPPPPAVSVSITPSTATAPAGGTAQFSATVLNASNPGVTWTASAGTVTPSGTNATWTAPGADGSYTVTATSVLDPTRTGSAAVTVTPVAVTITATSSALFREEGTTLTAAVSGTSDARVTWSTTCGALAGTGATVQFTAPETPGTCTVRATSVRDPDTNGEVALRIRSAWRVAALDDTNDGACTFAHCSLREALTAANANPDRDSIIILPASTPATITLTAALPFVTQALDLVGPEATALTINAAATAGAPRGVLYVNGDFSASLRGMTLRNGRRSGGGGVVIDNNANLTLRDVHVRDNVSVDAPGGGVLALRGGRGTLTDVHIVGNRTEGAGAPGGGLSVEPGSMVTMVRGRLADNESVNAFAGGARLFNGALVFDSTVISGNRALTTQGNLGLGGAVFSDGSQSTLQLVGATVENNSAAVSGGGLALRGGTTATITGGVIRGNSAPVAAGVESGGATVTAVDLQVLNNTASQRGGGVLLFAGGRYTHTGGALRGNVAESAGGGLMATGPATLINATFVGNLGTDYGAGIGTNNAGAVTVTNVLLSANLLGNAAGNCGSGGTSSITSSGGNLSDDTTCSTFTQGTDRPNTPAGVSATLADNGGPTFTHALLAGSAAIDAGVAAARPATDQRGFSRVGPCDIGAFEFGGAAPAGVVRHAASSAGRSRR